MESPTLRKGLLYVIRHRKTFGIHFLVKALEDGAKEMGHLSISTGRLSPKMVLAHTQILQGLVVPEGADRGGRDPAS